MTINTLPCLCCVFCNLFVLSFCVYKGVRARTGMRRELAARVDMNVLIWFGHVERLDNE